MKVVNKRYDPAYPVDQIKPSEKNVNQGDLGEIAQSISENGFYGACIVNERTGNLVIGEHRWRSAIGEGAKTVPVIFIDVDQEHERKIMLSDNRTTRLGTFNNYALAEELQAIQSDYGSLVGTGFDGEVLQQLIDDLTKPLLFDSAQPQKTEQDPDVVRPEVFEAPNATVKTPVKEGKCDDDETPEPEEQPASRLGDIWICGDHRVMCGDSTDREQVAQLMNSERADITITSPPYNVGKTPNGNKQKYANDADNLTDDDYCKLLRDFTVQALRVSDYVFVNIQCVAGNKRSLIDYLYYCKDRFADYIIWDKMGAEPAMGENILNSRFEFVLVFSHDAKRRIGKVQFRGTLENMLFLNSRREKDFASVHKATFPTSFALHFVQHFARPGAVIYEPFGGTGTTMIAGEKCDRRARSIELDPLYVDIAVRRWQKFTGREATVENDGRTFDTIALMRNRAAA